jgi:hypothetical protein
VDDASTEDGVDLVLVVSDAPTADRVRLDAAGLVPAGDPAQRLHRSADPGLRAAVRVRPAG